MFNQVMEATAMQDIEPGFVTRNQVVAISGVQGEVNWKPSKPFPKVGDTLTIKHQVKRAGNGDVLGLQRADGKGYQTKITAVYMDGEVRTGTSDTWTVKPGTTGHWETVNPSHV